MKQRKVNINSEVNVLNKKLSTSKCKYVMQFFVNDIPKFAVVTNRDKVKFKSNSFNESYLSLCTSSLQLFINEDSIVEKLVETAKKHSRASIKGLKNTNDLCHMLFVNATYNAFKTSNQYDFDFEFTYAVSRFPNMDYASKVLTQECGEIYISEGDDSFFIDYNNGVEFAIGSEIN